MLAMGSSCCERRKSGAFLSNERCYQQRRVVLLALGLELWRGLDCGVKGETKGGWRICNAAPKRLRNRARSGFIGATRLACASTTAPGAIRAPRSTDYT